MDGRAAVSACLRQLTDDASYRAAPIARRDNSHVYRVECALGVIAVKECIDAARRADPAAARREYGALEALAAAGGKGLAPAPLALLEPLGAYAMSWAEGRTLTSLALDGASSTAEAARLGERAGQWLRRFHALGATTPGSQDFRSRLDYAMEVAARVPRDRLIARAAAELTRRATAAATVETPHSWIHGDMKADNLMVSPASIVGLDVQLADRNSVVYDVAPFLNHLALLELSWRGLRQRAKLAALRDAFLRAYDAQGAQWVLPIDWLRAYLLLQAAVPENGGSALRRKAAGWRARIALRRVLARLAS